VRSRKLVGVVCGKRKTGEGANTEFELLEDVRVGHADDLLIDDESLHVYKLESKSVLERSDVEGSAHESSSLSDLGVLMNDVIRLGDLEVTLVDHDRDVKLVKKINFSGVDIGGSNRKEDITWRDSSDLGLHSNYVRFNLSLKLSVGVIGEDEADIELNVRKKNLELWHESDSFSLLGILVSLSWLLSEPGNSLMDEGVLSDNDLTLVLSVPKLLSSTLDLLG